MFCPTGINIDYPICFIMVWVVDTFSYRADFSGKPRFNHGITVITTVCFNRERMGEETDKVMNEGYVILYKENRYWMQDGKKKMAQGNYFDFKEDAKTIRLFPWEKKKYKARTQKMREKERTKWIA